MRGGARGARISAPHTLAPIVGAVAGTAPGGRK